MAKDPYNRSEPRKIRFTMTIGTAVDETRRRRSRGGRQVGLWRDRDAGWGVRKILRLRP
jgi:hypothetical protein